MEFMQPLDWEEALEVKAAHPEARPIFGGTDVMVELNFGRERPEVLMDLTRVPELREWGEEDGRLRIGAGVTYTRIIEELKERLPGLAMASRTVGSPQIRNRGTVGGNLGTSSPAGDALPPLYVSGAEVEVASVRGVRRIPVEEFVRGPKRNALREDELILSFLLPGARGPQQYAKIGPRNAMVIAVCSLGLALDPERRELGVCIGSAGPTPIRAREAEGFIRGVLEEENLWESRGEIGESALARFGELVAGAAKPISDVRGTAEYRRHAVAVLARRVLRWAWEEYREGR
ncbi:FAD binding domain-containing protein [Rubrobacter xylanophilus]|uniref:FAD binding domain-containing protein n=1 Tax=Rubrobacter xylanophilus TaxID=49319 RepID=UPI001C643CA1